MLVFHKLAFLRANTCALTVLMAAFCGCASSSQPQDSVHIATECCANPNTSVSAVAMPVTTPTDNVPYRLQSVATFFNVDVGQDSTEHGAAVVQNPNSGSAGQQWTLARVGPANYHIVNALSHMCLNVSYQSMASGAALQQWDCNDGNSELWILAAQDHNSFSIMNVDSNLVVDASTLGTQSGATLQQRTWTGQAAQKWFFLPLPTSVPTTPCFAAVETDPADQAVSAASNTASVTFNEAVDPASLTATTFTVSCAGTQLAGMVSYDAPSKTATFTPTQPFVASTNCSANVTTAVKSTAHTTLCTTVHWSFTVAPATQNPIVLPGPLSAATVYNVYPEIFSSAGNLAGVTAQLKRIHDLGFTMLYVMPVTPVGQPIGPHPAFNSTYAVHDFYAINPNYGTAADFTQLVSTAHSLGMQVILDEVLNHSAWDNALITTHPEYYVHTDGNTHNPNSIAVAFGFNDVAQFDYKTPGNGLTQYMTDMLKFWITTYNVDGFRFDTADDPSGAQRMIPQTFWTGLNASLQATKPALVMLGEEENAQLALAPFALDYGWNLQSALRQATTSGNSTGALQTAWQQQATNFPSGMLHITLLQDWDFDQDLNMYGGVPNTLDAAVFNFTINGIPMLFNGEEVANSDSGNNTHRPIVWNGANAASFTNFYTSLLMLRNSYSALQHGSMNWLSNSAAAQVATYTRTSAGLTFLVEINFSGVMVNGTLSGAANTTWKEVTPTGAPGGNHHVGPPAMALKPYDFAIFRTP